MKRLTYILALLPLLFASCEKVIDFDMEETERFVVLNSRAETDSLVSAHLTYSRFFLDNGTFENVTDATAWLDVNGTIYNGAHSSKGNYTFPYVPKPGDSLTMHVQVPGRDELTAAARMPLTAGISNLSYVAVHDSSVYEWGEVYYTDRMNVTFTLSDPGSEENYYRLRVLWDDTALCHQWTDRFQDTLFEDQYDRWYTVYTIQDLSLVNNTDLGSLIDNENGQYDGSSLLFTDANINGKNHPILLQVHPPVDHGELLVSSHPNITIFVESLSRDYFLYLKTAMAQSDEGLNSFFTEPTRIHSNVHGGRGIFGAVSTSKATIRTTLKP